MNAQPQHAPAPPAVSGRILNHGSRPRRRSSVPSVPTEIIRTKKPSPNYIRTQTASPEVISSLIDSLSAISASTHNHFENLPTSYGDSQSVPATPHPLLNHNAAVVDPETLHSPLDEIDDACEPPVIRTSKPPSGLSPITAPKKRDKDGSVRSLSYMGPSGGSSPSLRSTRSLRSVSSIGNISIEAGIPRKPSNASIRSSSESKRSSKGHRSLMYMPSLERMRMKDVDRKRPANSGSDAAALGDPTKKPAPQRPVAEDTIKEESVVAESSRIAPQLPSRGASPLRNSFNLRGGLDGASPNEQGLIPARGSSLRHSGSPSRKSKKSRRTRESTRAASHNTNTLLEEDENVDREPAPKDEVLDQLVGEDDEVARRIRELRTQKMLRERVAGKLPVGVDAGAPLSAASVSPLPSAELSPASSMSSASEHRKQAPAKALKILGIAMQSESAAQKSTHKPEAKGTAQPPRPSQTQRRHTRAQSSVGNDGDDFTPLPIDYKLALKALDKMEQQATAESTPSTRSNSKASVQTADDTNPSMSPPRRSRSAVAVGGRSASSRKLNHSSIRAVSAAQIDAPSQPRNAPPSASSDKTARPASDEITTRHLSLTLERQPAALHSLQQRPTVKKKRWSHPDLPVKAEKMHNDRMDAIEAAKAKNGQVRAMPVQRASHAVIEERPASRDSIDVDVETYLASSRLSQNLRHPQTGRVISFSEVGDPQGSAVFVCVGMGLTRFVMAFYDQLATTLKLRLITPDRPGIGGSQVDPNGTPLSWPGENNFLNSLFFSTLILR